MRNEMVYKVPGSLVTHLPVSEDRTLCGRTMDGQPWTSGYYGQLAEVTCKTCTTRIPRDAQYNRFTSPYKHAHPGEDGPMVYASNLDSTLTSKGVTTDNSKCTYSWLPSKDGDPNGLLIEWYAELEMFTVWTWNPHAVYLRQYQVRKGLEGGYFEVFDKDTKEKVGNTQTEQAAHVMARKMNNA